MYKKICVLLAISLATVLAAHCQDEKKPSEYASLLARVQGGDLSIDFKQLRMSYMESPERHQAKDTKPQKQGMFKALQSKDYKKAIHNADIVLENEFVDLDAHHVEQIAYEELNEEERASFHKAVVQGLLRSIMDSGDGKTARTAYVVISVHEEYIVLQVLGLRPSQQSVSHQDGHSYDVLEAKKQGSDQTVKLYFNVDIPFKHYLN
ncbi:MAG TPA: DUF4919 domain-containing protein [Candidatus Angelobacter sp.]|nr:DUF4919 domain-containing protein [Candidatus Angelobacter sp.]